MVSMVMALALLAASAQEAVADDARAVETEVPPAQEWMPEITFVEGPLPERMILELTARGLGPEARSAYTESLSIRARQYRYEIKPEDYATLRPRFVAHALLKVSYSERLRGGVLGLGDSDRAAALRARLADRLSENQLEFMRAYRWYEWGEGRERIPSPRRDEPTINIFYYHVRAYAVTAEDARTLAEAVVRYLVGEAIAGDRERRERAAEQAAELEAGPAKISDLEELLRSTGAQIEAAEAATGFKRREDLDPVFVHLSSITRGLDIEAEGQRARRAALDAARGKAAQESGQLLDAVERLAMELEIDAAELAAKRSAAGRHVEELRSLRSLWDLKEDTIAAIHTTRTRVNQLRPRVRESASDLGEEPEPSEVVRVVDDAVYIVPVE